MNTVHLVYKLYKSFNDIKLNPLVFNILPYYLVYMYHMFLITTLEQNNGYLKGVRKCLSFWGT